jgi:putative spermidine/putrescine transport system permease protein/spermidine/putrescine transport system permease protein
MAEAIHQAALAAQGRRESWRLLALGLPALTLVSVILFLPTGWLFALSFLDQDGALTLENYQRLLGSEAYVTIYLTTFKVSVLVTALSAAIGYPVAYLIAQLPPRAASLCLLTVLLPLWTSLLVRTYAWLVLLQRNGVINTLLIDLGLIDEPLKLAHNFTGATIGMTHIMVPFLVLPLYAAMKAIDPAHLRAATSLGASPARVFRDVFLPLSMPGLLVGCALVFVLCLGFYVTPALLGGGKVIMIAMRIDLNLRLYNSWGAASALGVVLLAATMLILLLAVRLGRIRLASLGG